MEDHAGVRQEYVFLDNENITAVVVVKVSTPILGTTREAYN